jgi:hypothetical protein
MQPSENHENSNMNLPKPVIETGGPLDVSPESSTEPEKLASSPETASALKSPKLGTPPTQAQIPLADPLLSMPPTSTATTPATNISTPAVADDNDLIEKEWVVKAKRIVDNTREDPYNQSRDMNVFKADYMKKRYNKIVKLSE